MDDFITIQLDGDIPLVGVALHSAHQLSEGLLRISALDDEVRLREEDPFTDVWTEISSNRIIALRSRFEFDLNRPPEKAVYLVPEDAWGLRVWRERLPQEILVHSLEVYNNIYLGIKAGLTGLLNRFQALVVFDLHSYNHRRGGPDTRHDNPLQNPEINVGTGRIDRDYWANVINRFMGDLSRFDFMGRQLDIRENVRFKGGYFPQWIHENFPYSVCCISIEVKKFFMDEWTGKPDHGQILLLRDAFKSTVPGVLGELEKQKPNPLKTPV